MADQIRVLIIVGIATFCLAPVAYAATGTATYFTPPYYARSPCNGIETDSAMIAAASDAIWNNGAVCGRMYRVRCTDGVPQTCKHHSVVVQVVDYCPGCPSASFDLSPEAFSVIADPAAGQINIEYNQ